MDASIQKYQAFVRTVELGSFTKAAESLSYSQSGVSRMVADLEREWKVALLERGRAGVRLTSEGTRLLPCIRRVCEEHARLQAQVDELNGLQAGLIRIGTFSSVATHWLPNVIRAFQEDYPNIDYELLLGDYGEIEEWVLEGRVDCGFLRLPAHRGLETAFIERDELLAVLPEGHPLAERKRVPAAELCEEPFLLLEKGDNTVDVVFDVVEEKTLPIQVTTNYLKIADGYILYGTDISKETVTLSGPSTELSKVETCTAEVTYNGELTSPVTLDTGLRFYTRSGGEVKFEYTTLETDSVEVTLQVYKLATLPVEVSFINAPRDFDPSVLVYSLSKKTLNVAGPESQIDRLSTLSVGTIDLSTFALDKVYEMPIELPSGIRLLDNISTITVSFDSSRLETKTMNLPASCVQVINLPSTYTLTVETERLMNVTLCGPAGSLEALNPEQVVIEIDADDFYVAIGQQNIACRLYVPANDKIFALGSYVVQCKIESN